LKVGQTVVPDIAELNTRFPALANQSQQTTWVQEVHLLWDTRDYPVTPSKGQSGEIFFEKTARGWGSDSNFIRYGLEGKQFFPWKNGNVTAIRGLYNWVNGPHIPFYELETLGGRETLRGYGEGRFNDKGRMLLNIEHRVKLTSIALMGVQTRFEVGPFFDLGTVFPNWTAIRRRDFRPVYGGSFRAAVKPNVVGSVDVGVGKEGPGVYVGINYPF
jgi:outer membrane protein assembly factor BamA